MGRDILTEKPAWDAYWVCVVIRVAWCLLVSKATPGLRVVYRCSGSTTTQEKDIPIAIGIFVVFYLLKVHCSLRLD